jgi:hypothetical protein
MIYLLPLIERRRPILFLCNWTADERGSFTGKETGDLTENHLQKTQAVA